MKYVLMYTSRPDLDAAVPAERREAVYGQIFQWFETNAPVFADSGAELQALTTATTVRTGADGETVVVDGPFSEAKEAIGGFSVIDVPDLDAALEVAKTWPQLGMPGIAVEVRPVVVYS
jgi:hypothetical protein